MSALTSPGLKAVADKTFIRINPYLEKLGGFALDMSPDFLGRTKYVAIPVVASGDAETFAQSAQGNYEHATGTLKYVDVQCNQHKKATFDLTDVDCLEIDDAPVWNTFAQAAADKIGTAIVSHALGLLTYTSADSQITCASVTLANVAAIAAQTMEAGYDPMQCTLILEPTSFFTLVSLLPSGVIGSGDVLKTAKINGAMFGFGSVQASTHISKVSGTNNNADVSNGIGFVVPNGAVAIATRLPKPPNGGEGYIEIGEQTDETNGFSLQLRRHVDPANGITFLNIESIFGAKLTKEVTSGVANGAPGYLQVKTA